jgi:predicted Co/Zn/Cd cation transporter (cation efflux family)
MNPWLLILLVMAGVVFGLDYLFRRKKWKDNSKEEKISLIVNMFSVGPHVFLSAVGILWGIVSGGAETVFGEMLHNVTLTMASLYFVVAIVAVILSFIFRMKGKLKASIWTNIIALLYLVIVLTVNHLAGELL